MKGILTVILTVFYLSSNIMAYEIIISRGERFDSSFKPIEKKEWLDLIKAKKELEAFEFIEGINPTTKEVIRIETPHAAKLSVIDQQFLKKNEIPFYFDAKGYIKTEYTNDDDLSHVKVLAAWLSASIYGEEGEEM